MYWNITDKERLVIAFTLAENPEVMEKFLHDLLTENEIKTCETRLRAMCMLKDLASYRQIEKMTGLSSATIARLAKKVDAREGGFQKIIKKFKKQGKPYFD